jgi:hypothetical protein
MKTNTHPGMWVMGLTAFCLLLGPMLVAQADGGHGKKKDTLEGTWRTTEVVPELGLFDLPGLITFSAGATRDNGTVAAHTDPGFVTPDAICLPLQGVWQKTGKRQFIGTDENFCDGTNGFAGIRTKYSITLDRSGNEFHAEYFIEFIDADGNNAFGGFVALGTLDGVRMQAEAP